MKTLAWAFMLVVLVAVLATPAPAQAVESEFETARVAATTYFKEIWRNVSDIFGSFSSGAAFEAAFLKHFTQTGGVERWGLPTSAIFEETPGTLTQYYQRGVVDWKPPPSGGAHTVQRRLAWDYLGGGLGGSVDQGVEPNLTNPHLGEVVGPWRHKVSNDSVEGVSTGFADFFHRLGGVASFGYPKTEARRDDHPDAELHDPRRPPDDRIRQYFQATVLEYHPESFHSPVKLRLLGDAVRDRRYPFRAWQQYLVFVAPEPRLESGEYVKVDVGERRGPGRQTLAGAAEFVELSLLRVSTDSGACGSGFFVTESGYAVTAWNLVQDANSISVSVARGYEAEAEIVAGDAVRDLALLKVSGDGHIPVTWGDAGDLYIHADTVALGYGSHVRGRGVDCYPETFVAKSSYTGKVTEKAHGYLRTIPAINSGHVGGPVARNSGRVVGISVGELPLDERANFLIPAAEVQQIVSSWIEDIKLGRMPPIPPRPIQSIVLFEHGRSACPGDRVDIEALGRKIELSATVAIDPHSFYTGKLTFTNADISFEDSADEIIFGTHRFGDDIVRLSIVRRGLGTYRFIKAVDNQDIARARQFHFRFVYDSGSLAIFINGNAAHLEGGLPYGENIRLRLDCYGSGADERVVYSDVRITGIPLLRD